MNATVPSQSGPSAEDVATELRAAGEALCRAARVLAALGRRAAAPQNASRGEPSSAEERLSGKQLGAIRAASRRAGLSRDRLAALLENLTGKAEPTALSRADASIVLDKLSSMTGYGR